MGHQQILLVLLIWTTVSKGQDTCSRFTIDVGIRETGNTGEEFSLENNAECGLQCHKTDNCTGFNFAEGTQTCQLIMDGPTNLLSTIPDNQWVYARKCAQRSLTATVASLVQTSPQFDFNWCDGPSQLYAAECEWSVLLRFIPCSSSPDKDTPEPGDSLSLGKNEFSLNFTLPEHWAFNNLVHKSIDGLSMGQCLYFVVFEQDGDKTVRATTDDDFCDGKIEITQKEPGRQLYEFECSTATTGIPMQFPDDFNGVGVLKIGIEVEVSSAVSC